MFDVRAPRWVLLIALLEFKNSADPDRGETLCKNLRLLTDDTLKMAVGLFEKMKLQNAFFEDYHANLTVAHSQELEEEISEGTAVCFKFLEIITEIIVLHNQYCKERDRLILPSEDFLLAKRNVRISTKNLRHPGWWKRFWIWVRDFALKYWVGRLIIWVVDALARNFVRIFLGAG